MKPAILKRLLLLGAAACLGGRAPAQTADEIIARARAYLGGDAALAAVNSVHLIGTFNPDGASPADPKSEKIGVEIIVQKPYQQRIVVTASGLTETTALDGYSAWEGKREGGGAWQINVLGADQVKRLQANTWDNLNFFKGIEKRGGTVESLGATTVDGHPAVKLAFTHDAGIVYTHYFDPVTGRLLLTETAQGMSTREEGEIVAGGVRFPRQVTQTTRTVDDKGQPVTQILVLNFDKVTLNETFPASDFEIPLTGPATPPPAKDLTSASGQPPTVAPGAAPAAPPPNPPAAETEKRLPKAGK